jgi:hypothetical protein
MDHRVKPGGDDFGEFAWHRVVKTHRKDESVCVTKQIGDCMSKRAAKEKPAPADYAARFAAEKAAQQRRYCDAFALWRACRRKLCRRGATCRGDPRACLKAALDRVSHAIQWRARQNILDTTPPNIGAPERAARRCMPRDFYEES